MGIQYKRKAEVSLASVCWISDLRFLTDRSLEGEQKMRGAKILQNTTVALRGSYKPHISCIGELYRVMIGVTKEPRKKQMKERKQERKQGRPFFF